MSNIVLEKGQVAPEFDGVNQNGEIVKLSDYRGRKVVLYFYPKDNTPGCIAEACNLNDNYDELGKMGLDVIGVSADSIESHKKFADKFNLTFNLISDPEKVIINKYGVWGEKNLYGKKSMGLKRTTFVINQYGVIEHVFKQVKTKAHTEQILKKINLI